MKLNMTKFLQAISLVLDLSALEQPEIDLNHSRRVAYISMMIAKKLGLNYEEKCDLYANAILHDNGFVAAKLEGMAYFENMPGHCIEGEANILKFPVYKKRKNIIKYHHENYDGTGTFEVPRNKVHIFSQIIHLADRLDVNFNLTDKPILERKTIEKYVRDNSGILFNPNLVKMLLEIMEIPRFWFDLGFYNIDEILNRVAPENILELSWKEILEMTDILVEIIDSKSRFTHMHTKGLVEKIDLMCDYYKIKKEKKLKMMIAGSLHDLGKLYISDSILDKPGKLNVFEFIEIKHHSYYTKLAIDKIPGFEDIAEWASNHHERLNGEGYPEGLTAEELDFESRLLAVLDIYQALEENRPYREGLSHEKIVDILEEMVENGEIDKEIVYDVIKVMKSIYAKQKSREKIAIITDDDKTNLKLLNMYIKKKGVKVFRASRGDTLIDLFCNEDSDIIFLDITLPGLNGFEAASKIRDIEKEKGLDPITIIGMSSDISSQNRSKCFASGMDGFIEKPFNREVVYKIIDEYI